MICHRCTMRPALFKLESGFYKNFLICEACAAQARQTLINTPYKIIALPRAVEELKKALAQLRYVVKKINKN